jgi:AMMECR1 domain-containing protein
VKNGFSSGLLLPQVATEWNWDSNVFLEQTCLKAGLNKNSWKKPGTEIFRFTADIFSNTTNPDKCINQLQTF